MLRLICLFSLFFANILVADSDDRKYKTFNFPAEVEGGDTLLTGIRGVKGSDDKVYISGFYNCPNSACVTSFVYKGKISGKGKFHELNFPSSTGVTVTSTNLYGPNNGRHGNIQVVGNYTTAEAGQSAIGCLYEGPLDGSGTWTTLIPTSSSPVLNTIAHSTMGGLVVGNYDTQAQQSKAFIYDIEDQIYFEIVKPGAVSITAYGIWHNGGDSYTICGGFSNGSTTVDTGYLVDWNNKKRKLTNFRKYFYKNSRKKSIITHFDGITGDGKDGYYLTGDYVGVQGDPELGFFAHVDEDDKAKWSSIRFPHHPITSGNSVYKRVVIGVYHNETNNTNNGYISYPD